MNPDAHLAQHHFRTAELRAEAEAYRLGAQARARTQAHGHRLADHAEPTPGLRTRLGWTLVEVGLRLATPKPALVPGSTRS
ncbi:hypothetical protein [Streptomyces cellulosae]|uniref:hypothetical protein n=1 Tax=Streptomyces cellulosae TaxID=1968 RepID=UPI0004C5DC0E|nr:hypothetical protein [Streptomyces cellulosae]